MANQEHHDRIDRACERVREAMRHNNEALATVQQRIEAGVQPTWLEKLAMKALTGYNTLATKGMASEHKKEVDSHHGM